MRIGREGAIDASLEGSGWPMITFQDGTRKDLKQAYTGITVHVDVGYHDRLDLYAWVDTGDGVAFTRELRIDRRTHGVALPTNLIPPAVWDELERRLTRAIDRARRGQAMEPLLFPAVSA
jgi:hypothetical protein